MASTNILRTIRTIEFVLLLGLVTGSGCAFTIWHEPACGVILLYLAVRLALCGIFVGA